MRSFPELRNKVPELFPELEPEPEQNFVKSSEPEPEPERLFEKTPEPEQLFEKLRNRNAKIESSGHLCIIATKHFRIYNSSLVL